MPDQEDWQPWKRAAGEARAVWDAFWAATPSLDQDTPDGDAEDVGQLLAANPRLAWELPLLGELIWEFSPAFPNPEPWEGGGVLRRLAEVLVARGCDLEHRRHEGLTPLMMAAERGNVTMVGFLIDHGSDIEARDDIGQTVLHFAADARDRLMITRCLDAGCDPNVADSLGRTPLHIFFDGSYSSRPDLVALLLSRGASPNARDHKGHTVLHLLARERYYEVESLRLLVATGADPFCVADDENSPWSLAVECENDGFLSEVRQAAYGRASDPPPAPTDVNLSDVPDAVKDLMERTGREWPWCLKAFEAFHVAAAADDGTALRRWLDGIGRQGSELLGHPLHSWRRGDELTPLQAAAADGHLNVARAILDFGWMADEETPWCMGTPLFHAVEAGHTEIAALLLEHGADPNKQQPLRDQREQDGRLPVTTALHEAARRGDAQLVSLLLSHGANPDARDWRGDTALHTTKWMAFGAGGGPSGVVDALVQAGASLLTVNELGQIPLAGACSPEARLTEQIMADQIVGRTLWQALIGHHMTTHAQSVEDARGCLEGLKASDPEVEWRVGIVLRDVRSKSGDGHRAGDVVLMKPCNNTIWDNLMVVRPKPSDGLLGAGTVAKASDHYDNMVIGVRESAVVQVESLGRSFEGDAQI